MKKAVLVSVVALLLVAAAGAASAAGSRCDDAIVILPGVTSGNMGGANSQWFRFTAAHGGQTPINANLPGTTFETSVEAYRACDGVVMEGDSGNAQRRSFTRISTVAGETYYIEVSRLSSGGDFFQLSIDDAPVISDLGSGDCFLNNGTPGCDDTCSGQQCPGCEVAVCGFDAFCCSTSWDDICAGEAMTSCTVIPVELQGFDIDE